MSGFLFLLAEILLLIFLIAQVYWKFSSFYLLETKHFAFIFFI